MGYGYGFNGKEKDDEVQGVGNQYDYGFRIYNPRLGRFLSIDPLFKTYPWYSPFQYAGNSPVAFIDLDGLERVLAISFDGAGVGATNYRIGHLEKMNAGEISSKILTNDPGQQIADAFVEASDADKNGIGFVAIWGHGSPNNQWGNTTPGMDKDDLGALEKAIADGNVSFTDNAIIYIGNCNAGTCDANGESFAQKIANMTGATVVAGTTDDFSNPEGHRGSVGVDDEKNGNMKYEMWRPSKDNFRAFEEGKTPVDLGGKIDLKTWLERAKTMPIEKMPTRGIKQIPVSRS